MKVDYAKRCMVQLLKSLNGCKFEDFLKYKLVQRIKNNGHDPKLLIYNMIKSGRIMQIMYLGKVAKKTVDVMGTHSFLLPKDTNYSIF